MNSQPLTQQIALFAREARRVSGFTAIELLVVVAVVAILATLALPSFNAVVSRYRVRTAVEDFTATIYFARSEAIRRGGGVVLRKATQAGCSAPGSQNWSCGWLVFADLNGNGSADKGDEVLQQSPAPRGVDVRRTTNASLMRLNQWGEAGAGMVGVVFSPADDDNVANKTALCLSSGGRLRVVPGVEECPG
ncbi:GspH/FimT family protein [Variovorax sp. dw_954]|uniref:GspH/FimT family pseudopilin n=1 Tax=Variovorax sp. dw_954 TaxID=2720078 RepID=UPI001BD42DE8